MPGTGLNEERRLAIVGHAFRQYDHYRAFPDDLRWVVFDLPHITQAG